MKNAIRISRWLLAAVFLYAGIIKVGSGERFAVTVARFELLPDYWSHLFRNALPWTEMLVGVLLLIPRTARIGAFAAAALLLMFIAALSWAWSQNFTIDCGCFNSPDDPPSPTNLPLAIARDAALLAITLLFAARRADRRTH